MTLSELVKPYLMLAALGFLVGFMTYLAMGRSTYDYAEEVRAAPPAVSASVAAPASGAWNIPKRI